MIFGTLLILLLYSTISNAHETVAQALAWHKQAIADNPSNAATHYNYAEYLESLDDQRYYPEAFQAYQSALARDPQNMNWIFSFGSFCCRIGLFQESIQAYQQILEHYPHLIAVLYNSGFTFKTAENIPLAIMIYRYILSKQPDYEPAHLGLSFGLISNGQLKEGWREHVWNLKKQNKYPTELVSFLEQGTIAGKRILLIPEGGIGDSMHFLRYAQKLKNLGAHIIVAIQPFLIPLFSRCFYVDELAALNSPVPVHDARCTLMTLPALFAEDEATVSQNIPYIFPDPERIAYWKNQLAHDKAFKIGICWQPDIHNDVSRLPIARRGIPLSEFYTVADLQVSLYSLQQKVGLEQLDLVPSNVTIHTFDDSFDKAHGSFMDTAAIMHSLDLIISTDTATAHLAGAMGKRVWLLLPYSTDWRWLAGRTDSPWYPTMRIFKQPTPFDWHSVMNEVLEALGKELSMQ